MNSIVKNLLISLGIGILAYFISQLISTGLHTPTGAELGIMATYILAVFVGTLIASPATGKASGRQKTGKPARRDRSSTRKEAVAERKIPQGAVEETGTVKWFNVKKGFGFITRDAGDDVFVHYRNIVGNGRRAINEGQRVRFIVIEGDKGLQADQVEAA